MKEYLTGLMDDNTNPSNLFDDEYYLFAGEGMSTRLHNIHSYHLRCASRGIT